MSRIQSIAGAKAAPIGVRIDAAVGEVIGTLGYFPDVLHSVMYTRLSDWALHHKLTVLKHNDFPGGRRAQKFLASRMWRGVFGRLGTSPYTGSLRMEAWMAAESGENWGDPDLFEHFEFGHTFRSTDPMAIPTGLSVRQVGRTRIVNRKRFDANLADRRFEITRSGALVDQLAASRSRKRPKGRRTGLFGVLRRKRVQAPILGWFDSFDEVSPRHLRRIDGDLDLAITAAGQEALAQRDAIERRLVTLGLRASRAPASRLVRGALPVARVNPAVRRAGAAMRSRRLTREGERA